ncbi:MAG: X-Pro dipeptidyl-peptidase, partial [Gemmatimonadales bacterium]
MAKIHIAASLALLMSAPAASGQSAPPAYRCRFVPVPVRDGIHLNTSVCRPDGPHGPLPLLLTRTPYGI